MSPSRAAAVLATIVLALLAIPALGSAASFSGTYGSARVGWDWATWRSYSPPDCGHTQPFIGAEPDAGSGHPVLVYVPDSTNLYDGSEAKAFLSAASAAGFVAVSAKFEPWLFNAPGLDANAMCIDGGTRPRSVVAQACARPTADCSKGIVVAGFSQGAAIQLRAANHDSRVRAAYLIGVNEDRAVEAGARWRNALAKSAGTRALPDQALRIVNGELDSPSSKRDELDAVTGTSCAATAFSCLRADGSGWYVVRHSQVADKVAGQCYHHADGDNLWCAYTPMDRNWLSGTDAWALPAALAWLHDRTDG